MTAKHYPGAADHDESIHMEPMKLPASVRTLLDGKNFATIATINPDGGPQSSVTWIDRDGDFVVFSATRSRQKVKNLMRDPRVSIAVYDHENPYHSVEIRGRAEVVPDPERSLPFRLSHKYLGEDPPDEPGADRVVVRVVPSKVNEFTV